MVGAHTENDAGEDGYRLQGRTAHVSCFIICIVRMAIYLLTDAPKVQTCQVAKTV